MNLRHLLCAVGSSLTGLAALSLIGCGGGSSSPVTGGSVTRSSLTGIVQAPQSQTRGVKRTRGAGDPLVAVPGATVSLVNLDDTSTPGGKAVGTTTTGANGSYTFPSVAPGTNYKIEATKAIGNKTLTLDAIVTAPPLVSGATTAPPPVTHDLTPTTTVATVTALQQVAALKAIDPNAKSDDLQSIADDLTAKRATSNTPPPDCTDPNAVTTDANTLKLAAAPNGSYAGEAVATAVSANNPNSKIGDRNRLAAQIDATGHVFIIALPGTLPVSTSSTDTGNGGNGNNSGSGGNGDGSGNSGSDSGDNFAVGMVTSDGIVNATTKNGKVKVTGLFTAGVGVGTWQQTDGSESGKWTLTLLKNAYAGLYAGKHHTDVAGNDTGGGNNGSGNGNGNNTGDGSGNNTGNNGGNGVGTGGNGGNGNGGKGGSEDFALLVLDDGTCYIVADGGDQHNSVKGAGTVDSSGAMTFTIHDSNGSTITGTGSIDAATHTLTGTYSSTSGEMGHFTGRSNHADNSDL